ncbi:802_t:CDS:1, partial [Ambispora leptoticha]
MSTSTTELDAYLVENWDTESLVVYLQQQDLKLNDKHFDVLRNREIDGQVFLDMSKDDFMQAGLEMGPAMKLAKEVKALKDNTKRAYSSY